MTKRKGFTLIEVLLVIAIIAVVGFLGNAFYSNFYLNSTALSASRQLTAELRKAQTYSMTGKQGSGWGVAFTGGNIVLYNGTSYATRNTVLDEDYSVPNAVSITGFTEVDFARLTGYPNATATAVITGGSETYQVAIQPQGIIVASAQSGISNGGTGSSSSSSNPVPTLTSLSPTSTPVGSSQFMLTLSGSNFVSSSVVDWNGTALTTTYVLATQLEATVPATDVASVGTASVTVVNPTPGGGTSGSQTFTTSPIISTTVVTSSAASAVYGSSVTFTATVTPASGGAPSGVVTFMSGGSTLGTGTLNGANPGVATFATSSLQVSGSPYSITASYGGGGTLAGSTSTVLSQAITAKALTVTGITASNKTYDGTTAATLSGTPGTLVGIVGSDTVSLTGTAAGTFATSSVGTGITVSVSGQSLTGAQSTNYSLTEPTTSANITDLVPTLASISPTSTAAGGSQFTLTATGTNFVNGESTIYWNSSPLTSTFVSSSSLTATVPATDIASAGTASVTVVNAAPGGGTSGSQTFTITSSTTTGSTSTYIVLAAGTGSWTVPVGVTSLQIQLWGGGGGGAVRTAGGYSGGAGAYVVESALSVTPGGTITYNIATGGGGGGASIGLGGNGYRSGGSGCGSPSTYGAYGAGGGGSSDVTNGTWTYIAAGGGGASDGSGDGGIGDAATSTSAGTGGVGTYGACGSGGGGGSGTAGMTPTSYTGGVGGTGGTAQTGMNGNGANTAGGGSSAGVTGNGIAATDYTAQGANGSGGASGGASGGGAGSNGSGSDSGGGGGYNSTGNGGVGGQPAAGGGGSGGATSTYYGGTGGAGELVISYTAPPPILFVQSATSTAVGGSQATVSISGVAAGDFLVVTGGWFASASSYIVSCSDNYGDMFSAPSGIAFSKTFPSQSQFLGWLMPVAEAKVGAPDAGMCYAPNVHGGNTTVTVTINSALSYAGIAVNEFSGVATANPYDVSSMNTGGAVPGSGSNNETSYASTTNSADLVVGLVLNDSSVGSAYTPTAGTGFTLLNSTLFSLGQFSITAEYLVQSSATSVAATFTYPTSSLVYYWAAMGAFEP